MITAEILKPCVVCCQPGSIVEVTEEQFRFLGGAARPLDNDAPAPYEIADTVPAPESVENPVESVENAGEIAEPAPEMAKTETESAPEAAAEPAKKKSGRKKA